MPEVSEFSELGDYLDLLCRTYWSGMMLRLAFGVSTAIQPEIILLDELIGVGDVSFTERSQLRLNKIMTNAHILVLASHNLPLLERYCNRAVWLKEGCIAAEGRLDGVMARMAA